MLNHLIDAQNVAYTTNGARAFATTKDNLLDFFAKGGAMRNASENEILSMFTAAFGEDSLSAMRMLFYFRDVRGGQGERRLFNVIVKYLAEYHTDVMRKNLHLVPEYGRFDDWLVLFGTRLHYDVLSLIKTQLHNDMKSDNPSLCAKWMPSLNASSFDTIKDANTIRSYLNLTPRNYRKMLSGLRKKIRIVEAQMSANRWHLIQYDKLPSKAGLVYRNAFNRHDPVRYQEFLDAAVRGEKKVNASTLYPYEILEQIPSSMEYDHSKQKYFVNYSFQDEAYLNAAWSNLPDYFNGSQEDSLVVIDTSGSMRGRPIAVAVSLGVYIAERNKGAFHNHFISFSAKPKLHQLKGSTFCEKVKNITKTDWDQNTNIEAVFDLVLDTAIENKLPQDQLPKRIFIVSDMAFDKATSGGNDIALFRNIRARFESVGYQMPTLVFWNVNATSSYPMTVDDRGVLFVSGASPSILKNLLNGKIMDAVNIMMDTIHSERYQAITV